MISRYNFLSIEQVQVGSSWFYQLYHFLKNFPLRENHDFVFKKQRQHLPPFKLGSWIIEDACLKH